MTIHLGDVPSGSTLYIPFASYNSSGASVTLTGLAVTGIEIYKNGSEIQRASDAGYTLLDTDGIDFDTLTGIHGFSVNLADNTDAGFYSVGAFYWVVVTAVTIDTQTVNFIPATFRIVAAEAIAGKPKVDVDAINGVAQTATLDTIKAETASILADTAVIGAAGAGLTEAGGTGDQLTALATAANLAIVDVVVDAVKAKTDNLPAAPAATSDIPTANANADALLDRSAGIETSRTVRQGLRLMLAALCGKASGLATTTAIYRDTNDGKDRITATVDASGNRSAVTYDAS